MAGARRSARHSTVAAPKYTQSSSDDENIKAQAGTTAARRKRAREIDDAKPEEAHLPKKTARSAKTVNEHPPSKSTKVSTAPPQASSDTNRDADGNQEVFWLLKAEPLPRYENGVNVAFSIDDLKVCTEPEPWSGVRNPQARNNMQAMRKGDLGFFYHSNAKPSGVAGLLRIVEEAKVDESAFDPKDPYYDPKSDKAKPKWYCVGVEFVKKFDEVVDLHKIKSYAGKGGKLEHMQLVTNSRLSVSRVRKEEWHFVNDLAEAINKENNP